MTSLGMESIEASSTVSLLRPQPPRDTKLCQVARTPTNRLPCLIGYLEDFIETLLVCYFGTTEV